MTVRAGPAARRALLASGLGWLFDGYETYALILVGADAIRDLVAPDRLAQLPLYFRGLTAVTLLGWATGGLAFGVIADYLGRRRSVAASQAPFLVDDALALFMVAAAANGFFSSGQFAWMAVYLPEVYPTAVRGTGTAVVCNSARYLAAFGPLVAGWVVESLGGIAHAAALMSGIYVLGLAATPFAAPETRGQPPRIEEGGPRMGPADHMGGLDRAPHAPLTLVAPRGTRGTPR